jgi:hypothetical protein
MREGWEKRRSTTRKGEYELQLKSTRHLGTVARVILHYIQPGKKKCEAVQVK